MNAVTWLNFVQFQFRPAWLQVRWNSHLESAPQSGTPLCMWACASCFAELRNPGRTYRAAFQGALLRLCLLLFWAAGSPVCTWEALDSYTEVRVAL